MCCTHMLVDIYTYVNLIDYPLIQIWQIQIAQKNNYPSLKYSFSKEISVLHDSTLFYTDFHR